MNGLALYFSELWHHTHLQPLPVRAKSRTLTQPDYLVPAVCWSMSVFRLIQLGLKPVCVDVDPVTFNATVAEMEKRMTPRIKAVMAVHVLGNSTDMIELADFVKRHVQGTAPTGPLLRVCYSGPGEKASCLPGSESAGKRFSVRGDSATESTRSRT